jgi:hypothetical protein
MRVSVCALRRCLLVLGVLIVSCLASPALANAVVELIFDDGFEKGGCRWSSNTGYAGTCDGVYDFSCAGAQSPAAAPDPLTVAGTWTDLQSGSAIQGATVEARRRSNDALLDTDTTTATGAFSLSATTGSVPLDAYLTFSASSYPATYFYPADPLAADELGLQGRAVTSSALAIGYFLAGGYTIDVSKGTAVVVVVDCYETAVAGATVSFTPAAQKVAYLSGNNVNASATSTDETGIAIGLNVPAGDATVGAARTLTLESHGFELFANGLSGTAVHP